jgi:hypothetical protein
MKQGMQVGNVQSFRLALGPEHMSLGFALLLVKTPVSGSCYGRNPRGADFYRKVVFCWNMTDNEAT